MQALSQLLNALENICSMDLLRLSDLVAFPDFLCMFLKFCILKLLLSIKCELVLADTIIWSPEDASGIYFIEELFHVGWLSREMVKLSR